MATGRKKAASFLQKYFSMNGQAVHIVCLDAPSPPDYGGVYDLYYKIPALAKSGYKITLHYFDYKEGRGAKGLESFCSAIYKYPRKSFAAGLFSSLPYIVYSRICNDLITRLNRDKAPVILEGIHCSGVLPFINKQDRKIILRIHNNEAVYYKELACIEKNFFKQAYLLRESRLLKKYQASLPQNLHYSFVAESDEAFFKREYLLRNTCFVPVFIPWGSVDGKLGRGKYCLYHGNLSVAENIKAVTWLVENVFVDLDVPLIIAGKTPGNEFKSWLAKYPGVQLIADPSHAAMAKLVADAQIHLLPSFNKTGVKLKLLHALFNGRFCITNQEGAEGSGIRGGLLFANTADEYKIFIKEYFGKEFSTEDIAQRLYVAELYNSDKSAAKISAFL